MDPGGDTDQSPLGIRIYSSESQAVRLYISFPAMEQPYVPVDSRAAVPTAAPGAAFYRDQDFIFLAVSQIVPGLHGKIRIAVSAAAHFRLVDKYAGIPVNAFELQHHMSAPVFLGYEKPLVVFVLACVNISGIASIGRPLLLLLMEHGVMGQIHPDRIPGHPENQFKWIQILPYLPSLVQIYFFHLHPPRPSIHVMVHTLWVFINSSLFIYYSARFPQIFLPPIFI